MRDCGNNRTGFERVLMAVAATFLTVSAGSALAQSDPSRSSPAELAIDAAIPRPEPANLPPPTIDDFKLDTTATVPDAAKAATAPVSKPSDIAVNSSKAEIKKDETRARRTPPPPPRHLPVQSLPRSRPRPPATFPQRISRSPTSCARCSPQNRGDTLTERSSARRSRNFTVRVSLRRYSRKPVRLMQPAKASIARLKDAASDGLNASDYPVPDFTAASTPEALAEADLKLTASMLDYARHAQSGRMHWSQVSGDIQYPEHPTDPNEVLANVSECQGCLGGARELQPSA